MRGKSNINGRQLVKFEGDRRCRVGRLNNEENMHSTIL